MRAARLWPFGLVMTAVICGIFFHAACAENAPAKDTPLLFGIYVGSKGDFWADVEKGGAKAAAERGYAFIYRGAAETDLVAQREIFTEALNAGAKGIFVAPNTPERVEDVARARAKGVPVVYIDRTMGDHPPIISFIGTNNYEAGKFAAQELIKKIGPAKTANVVVFRMDKAITTTSAREAGFIDTVKEAGYNMVADFYVTSEIGEARSRIARFLESAPKFDAVFTPNEKTTIAAFLTLNEKEKFPGVHIGFDGGKIIDDAIRDGLLYGTVVQQPFKMGYYGVMALDDALHGRKVVPEIESGMFFVNKDNVDTYQQDLTAYSPAPGQ